MQKLLLAIAATAVFTTSVNALGDVERSQWRGAMDGHVRGQAGRDHQEHTMEHKHVNLRRKNHPHVLESQQEEDKIYETPVLIKKPESTLVRTLASVKNEIDDVNHHKKHQIRRGQLLDKRKELKEQMWREQPEVEVYQDQVVDNNDINFKQNEYIKIDPKDKVFKPKPLQAADDETTTVVDDEIIPNTDETPVVNDETAPAPVDGETTPVINDETTPTPADETTPVVNDETTPVDGETTPIDAETTPTTDDAETTPTIDDAEKTTEEEEKEEKEGDDAEKEEDKKKDDEEEEQEDESSSSSSSSGDHDEEEHSADEKKDKHNKEEEEEKSE